MRSPRLVRVLVGAALLTLFGAGALVGRRFYLARVPPDAGLAAASEEEAAFGAAGRVLRGTIVWSSNRSGSHEILRLDLVPRGHRLRALTNHPHVDTFPRFSPDGSRILFNRSQRPWVSFREREPWDVWIMNADGSGQRLVARHAYHASFAPDGRSIVFDRSGRIVERRLDSGEERILVDGRERFGAETTPEPELFGQRLAMTIRGRRDAVGVFDLESSRYLRFEGGGCQVAWWPDGARLVWVQARGVGGNRVMAGAPDGQGAEVLIDLPEPHSHEYFPRLSRDGSWLALGATAKGHEHDRADYEIFLWQVGRPWDSALRLTWHSGNDQWPDLRLRDGRRD